MIMVHDFRQVQVVRKFLEVETWYRLRRHLCLFQHVCVRFKKFKHSFYLAVALLGISNNCACHMKFSLNIERVCERERERERVCVLCCVVLCCVVLCCVVLCCVVLCCVV